MVLLLLLVVAAILTASPGANAQEAARAEAIARNLAQNVLGDGTVRWVRVRENGRQVDIGWDAVLYRSANTAAHNRRQLRDEAELATGSIMGVMRPVRIRFSILIGDHVIAHGERTPGNFTITYAKELGG